MVNIAKIFSTLGNSQALTPLAIKDGANALGATAGSAVTSKDEAVDRCIDEFGTEAIWLGGIPLFKKVCDKTIFKLVDLDAKYDVRNLQNKEIYEKTKEWAPTQKIKNNIEKISSKEKMFKNLNVTKFVVSTALALGTYNVMTDLKQKYTNNKIRKKIIKEHEENSKKLMNDNNVENNVKDKQFQNLSKIRANNVNNNQHNPNFKGLYNVMLDPVKNMMVMDVGITSERLAKSRSPQELVGYATKEAGFLFFMYYLGQKVQEHFENVADKKHNKSIKLDARVLEDEHLKNAFANKSIEESLNSFPKSASDIELYDYINTAKNNMVINAAKQSDIIQTYKQPKKWYQIFQKSVDTGKVDTRKYIDLKQVRATHSHIEKLYNQFNESGQTVDEFFKDVRKLKRGSILKNMGSTMLALGVILPGIMLAERYIHPDNKEFAVEKDIKKELIQEKIIA